ncbi:MAG: FkbM family methyltransferase [Desulfobacterium sp.]|nr:FkbM family methyltransferase [Desulfobacterium sp.]
MNRNKKRGSPADISNQNMAKELLQQGKAYFEQGHWEVAEQHFLEAVQKDPTLAEAFNNLGVVYWQNNDHQKSVEQFKTALSIDPQNKEALANLEEIIEILRSSDTNIKKKMDDTPPNTERIKIVDNLEVTVPLSNALMTPFVLKEQLDWFEDEIIFIRDFIQPGMTVIDIGANYGLYTLSCAKKCGKTGEVWAFEPTVSVAECLNDSLRTNGFSNTTLINAGLSNRNGEAKLSLNPNAELNSLNASPADNGEYEVIKLKTLDECAREYNWEKIDFIKLDAEGEEVRIIEGGTQTLEKFSPVIMYELKHGDQVNLSLINAFKRHGYAPYHLIPGPQLLIPFNPGLAFDGFLLNLFAIKDETALTLKNKKKLINDLADLDTVSMDDLPGDLWKYILREKAFSTFSPGSPSVPIIDQWVKTVTTSKERYIQDLSQALNFFSYYLIGKDPNKRLKALLQSEEILGQLSGEITDTAITMTRIRVLMDIGRRGDAVVLLDSLIEKIISGEKLSYDLPFFPVSERYDNLPTGISPDNWLISSIVELYEKKKTFSSYFAGKQSIGNLEYLMNLGYCDDEIKRRLNLLKSLP